MSEPGPTDPTFREAATPGSVLAGRFRVERVLGRGGMGEVLLALDTLLGRPVAVKHLRADTSRDANERRTAILKEARRGSRVNDPRIAAIHDVVDLGGDLLIVMEYVEGETLRRHLGAPLALDRFWNLAGECLEALGAAHTSGVIHRDIKPENLMLTRDDGIKILDFGLAWRSSRGDGAASPQTGTLSTEIHRGPAGTPQYMAPEAHYGGRVDERTDLFALGAVFYEMLTARSPFAAETYEGVLDRVMNSVPRPVAELNPAVTPELSDVVGRMLARDPAQRFASCADARAAVLAAKRASGAVLTAAETLPLTPAGTRSPGPAPRIGREPRTRSRMWTSTRTLVWALVGIAVAFSAGLLWRVAATPRLPVERRLAVLPPDTPRASEDFAAYALGATELLAVRLTRHQDQPGFQMATFAESFKEKLASPADARRALGANLVLVPTLEQRENRLRARLELRQPSRERPLDSRSVDVAVAEPFAFADSLYQAALALLHLPRRPQTAQADVGVRGAGTLRFLLQGMGRRRAATTTEARQRSLEDFETAYRTEPDPAAPRAWLAAAQITMFNATRDTTWLVRAEASAREAVSLDSSRSETHRTLGGALTIRKRFAEALEQYRIASALEPTDDDAWHFWGRTWQRLGRPDEERKVYLAAIARRPHAFKPRWWLASWEYNNGHVDEAVVAFREMIRRAPEFSTGYSSLGGLLLFRGNYQNAIDTLRLAVELGPSAGAFSNLGTAYFSAGQLAQAVEAYNQAFQFGDADHVLWMNLGDAYHWLHDRPGQARDAYRQAVRLGRERIAARFERGSAPDPMIPALLASVFPKLGEPDSARAMLRQSLALDSLNSRVQYQAALTLWQLDERVAAMGWLRRAVSGGFPVVWLRDSPVHRDWRGDPGFQSLLASVAPAESPRASGKGGTR